MSTRSILRRRAIAATVATAVLGAGAFVAGATPAAAEVGGPTHTCGYFFDPTTDDGLLTHALSDVLQPLFPMGTPPYVKENTTCLAQRTVNSAACGLPLLAFLRGTASAPC
jgi:hypothetical protein